MSKKRLSCDRVETYFAAVPWSGPRDRILWGTIRPTALEAAEALRRHSPAVSGFEPPAQIVEIKIGWNLDAQGEIDL